MAVGTILALSSGSVHSSGEAGAGAIDLPGDEVSNQAIEGEHESDRICNPIWIFPTGYSSHRGDFERSKAADPGIDPKGFGFVRINWVLIRGGQFVSHSDGSLYVHLSAVI